MTKQGFRRSISVRSRRDRPITALATWPGPGTVAILMPSPMPAPVLVFSVPGGYAVSCNSVDAMLKGDRHCAYRRGSGGFGEPRRSSRAWP
jgi:hypothetical protein